MLQKIQLECPCGFKINSFQHVFITSRKSIHFEGFCPICRKIILGKVYLTDLYKISLGLKEKEELPKKIIEFPDYRNWEN